MPLRKFVVIAVVEIETLDGEKRAAPIDARAVVSDALHRTKENGYWDQDGRHISDFRITEVRETL